MSRRAFRYFDDGLGRTGLDEDARCPVNERCALYREHGGSCDPRPEPERWRVLFALLDRGYEGDALAEAVQASARQALARAR